MRTQPQPNYDESKVPSYELPDPLVCLDGEAVKDGRTWDGKRRGEIFGLFERHVYGRRLPEPEFQRFEVVDHERRALGGAATRKQVVMRFSREGERPGADMLIYLPNGVEGPVPLFVGLNFFGNQTIHPDPGIRISSRWMRPKAEFGVAGNRSTEASRGVRASRWPVETILGQGFGLAVMYYGDFALDHRLKFRQDALSLFQSGERRLDDAGAIGAWAWGLSRAMDYFETDKRIDARRVAVIGHSRLGKTALWAGACDTRFALAISNNSGCGGAALSRRCFGETVERINTAFPHWFCKRFRQYNRREDQLPVDQHMLVALMAPRPVYVASATQDLHADPRGEFLATLGAGPVFRLLGRKPLPVRDMPPAGRPARGDVGYHLREGKHDLTAQDWGHYLAFARRVLKRQGG